MGDWITLFDHYEFWSPPGLKGSPIVPFHPTILLMKSMATTRNNNKELWDYVVKNSVFSWKLGLVHYPWKANGSSMHASIAVWTETGSYRVMQCCQPVVIFGSQAGCVPLLVQKHICIIQIAYNIYVEHCRCPMIFNYWNKLRKFVIYVTNTNLHQLC